MNINENYYYIFNFNNDKPLNIGGIDLYQVSDQSCKTSKPVKPTSNDRNELLFFYGGEGNATINGQTYNLCSNNVITRFTGDKFSVNNTGNTPLRFYIIGYNIQRHNPIYNDFINIKKMVKEKGIYIYNCQNHLIEKVKELVSEIYFNDNDQLGNVITSSLLNEIIAYSLKIFSNRDEHSFDIDILAKKNLVYNIITYLNDNLFTKDALKDISNKLNYSYSHLSHVFSQTMNSTLKDYFSNLQMETAKKMLESGKKVTDVSESLHYSSIHSFSRAYKNYFNISPSKLKNSSKA